TIPSVIFNILISCVPAISKSNAFQKSFQVYSSSCP
uniref:Uncharacterized protein n=1 Tax=Ciona savignyi TaxID=51511 RepID=H2YYD3_CIOSA